MIQRSHPKRARSTEAMWPSALAENFFETTGDQPSGNAIWCYTQSLSYGPGERMGLCVSSSADVFEVRIYRDGASAETVFQRSGLKATFFPAPIEASSRGCGWPVALEIDIPATWRSGGYVVEARAIKSGFADCLHHHVFIVRPDPATPKAALLQVASTGTWAAYNDWGGSNFYEGITGPAGVQFSPVVSLARPFSRGFAWLPEGAPRIPLPTPPPPGAIPRYPHMEWAYANGFSKKYASAGWASYDRHFLRWAEARGINVEMIAQHDLQTRPELLSAYPCVVFVGHDEYWTWEMRDAIDTYVDNGGRVARFAGNFLWQMRFDPAIGTQTCYKYRARSEDPVLAGGHGRLTSAWEDPLVGRPGALTFGLNATRGMYAGWGLACPRGPGGFTVYRPEHWAFEGTDLYYGDLLGAAAKVFGYEVDGLEYTFRDGLPYPTGNDGAPVSLEILAMGLATLIEADHGHAGSVFFLAADDLDFVASTVLGSTSNEAREKLARGSGMIVSFRRAKGEVFHAGTCEWVSGLIQRDPGVERVTGNVLARFAKLNL
jgi:hypothetical protein